MIRVGDMVTVKIDQLRTVRQIRTARDTQDRGMIEPESPLGQALLGQEKGRKLQVETPGGTVTVEILAVGKEPPAREGGVIDGWRGHKRKG